MVAVSLGDIVLYRLDDTDASKINAWRANFRAYNANYPGHKHPHQPGTPGATGHVAHTGLEVTAGMELPAMIVSATEPGRFGLKVFLHGNDEYWAVSVPEGGQPGEWSRRP